MQSILFFGSDLFSVRCLDMLLKHKVTQRLHVVTPPLNPREPTQGQLYKYATRAGVPTSFAPPKTLQSWQPPNGFDLGIVVSFGYFLPASLIHQFRLGTLNVHPSLLPKYRGSSPIQRTILNNDTEAGVTVLELGTEAFDTGRLLKQTRISIPATINYRDLHDKLADIGSKDLLDTINNLQEYQQNSLIQNEAMVSYAPKIPKSFSNVLWHDWTAYKVLTVDRAVGAKTPLFTFFRQKRVQLFDLYDPYLEPKILMPPLTTPGKIVYDKQTQSLLVQCKDKFIGIKQVLVQAKRMQSSLEFRNGYQLADECFTNEVSS
jgi:methionyl-tRNA formyltransferase